MATRTISAAGGNYNATGTWDEGIVPTSADDVVVRADGTSGSVTVTAAAAALTLNLTAADAGSGYTGTITINSTFTLSVSGSITLNLVGTTAPIAGAGSLAVIATSTLTSNGKTIASQFHHLTASITLTIADTATLTGLFTVGNNTVPAQVITSSNRVMICSGGVNVSTRVNLTSTTIRATAGTLSGSQSLANALQCGSTGIFEIAGDVTMAGSGLAVTGGTFKITSGTISSGSMTLNGLTVLGALSLPTTDFRCRASGTLTLSSPASFGADFNTVGATLTLAGAQTVTLSGTFSVTATGSDFNPGDCTVVMGIPLIIATASAIRFRGSHTFSTVTMSGTGSLTVDSGQTLTVTTLLQVLGTTSAVSTIKSQTASSAFTLALSGATIESAFCIYTDVTVTGAVINNAFSGAVTRCTGVVALTTNEALDSADPGIANVLFNTAYTIDGAALTGTFVGKSSYGSIS